MSNLPIILGMDISASNMGLAIGRPGDAPRCWSVRLKKADFDDEDAGVTLLKACADIVRVERPEWVYIEAPLGPVAISGATNAHSVTLLAQLAYVANVAFRSAGAKTRWAHVQSVRKAFVGEGRPEKRTAKKRVAKVCDLLGWKVKNDDEADAAAVWWFGTYSVARDRCTVVLPKLQGDAKLAIEGLPGVLRRAG
jgi:Holliday junction resolvasome RuvABC endonuclease subunit